MAATRLKSLAGVRIPDTKLANAALDLLEATSPHFLFNHCLRTYVFGSLAVRAAGREVVDEEIAFCGALLHDLGLVPIYTGSNRFEVDGADAARRFCLEHHLSPQRADRVWEAIALHTSAGIASRMAAEIAVVHFGAGLEVISLRRTVEPIRPHRSSPGRTTLLAPTGARCMASPFQQPPN
jgi:hypothetical protein